jgi:hypothetical protein
MLIGGSGLGAKLDACCKGHVVYFSISALDLLSDFPVVKKKLPPV